MSWLDTLEDIRKKDFSTSTAEERDKAARDVINMGSYACAVVAVSPIPFSDAVLMLPVQSAMVMTIGHIYGRKVTQADAKELVVELVATAGAGMLARQGIKALLPMVGALLTVPAAFAANWAIGRVAMDYFRNPGVTREQMKKIYEAAKAEGGSLFSKERFDAFRKAASGGGKPTAEAAEEEDDEEEESAEGEDDAEDEETEEDEAPAADVKKKPKSPVARIVEDEFAARVARNQDVREAIDGVIHLDITGEGGGLWTVDFTAQEDFISRGHEGEPKLTVRCEAANFIALLEGRKSAQVAVMSGELELDPMDLDLAMKLGPLFKA
jgi:uncharacterized protein (DUF697 family)